MRIFRSVRALVLQVIHAARNPIEPAGIVLAFGGGPRLIRVDDDTSGVGDGDSVAHRPEHGTVKRLQVPAFTDDDRQRERERIDQHQEQLQREHVAYRSGVIVHCGPEQASGRDDLTNTDSGSAAATYRLRRTARRLVTECGTITIAGTSVKLASAFERKRWRHTSQ